MRADAVDIRFMYGRFFIADEKPQFNEQIIRNYTECRQFGIRTPLITINRQRYPNRRLYMYLAAVVDSNETRAVTT